MIEIKVQRWWLESGFLLQTSIYPSLNFHFAELWISSRHLRSRFSVHTSFKSSSEHWVITAAVSGPLQMGVFLHCSIFPTATKVTLKKSACSYDNIIVMILTAHPPPPRTREQKWLACIRTSCIILSGGFVSLEFFFAQFNGCWAASSWWW